jgi:sulfide dehydrogenase cytochrome subunit
MNIKLKGLSAMLLCLLCVQVWAADPPHNERPDVWLMSNACAGCHGTYGHSVGDAPTIAGLSKHVFIQAMLDYRSGARPSSVMDRIAKGYTEADFVAMAEFFQAR